MKEMLNIKNPEIYAEMFIKNMPTNPKKILMYGIGHKRTIEIIIEHFTNSNFVIADREANIRLLKHFYMGKRFTFINISDDETDINILQEILTMPKFDVAIMNPPYDKNLHLKILEIIVSKVNLTINISPIRWLQDPLAKYKSNSNYLKFENSISKHLISLESIKSNECDNLFGVRFDCDLGIYTLNEKGGFDYKKFNSDRIIDKVRTKWINAEIENNKKNGWRIKIPTINGVSQIHGVKYKDIKPLGEIHIFFNGKKNGKKWYEFWSCNQHSKTTDEITHSISFNSKDEAQNFANVFDTKFGKYVQTKMQTDIHLENYNLLWLNDYTKPWSDKKLCKYFGITGYIDDEHAEKGSDWALILKTMEEIK